LCDIGNSTTIWPSIWPPSKNGAYCWNISLEKNNEIADAVNSPVKQL